jgi:hypothetical protein
MKAASMKHYACERYGWQVSVATLDRWFTSTSAGAP